MAAMINNDIEKEWMAPLLDFRNTIDFRGDDGRKRDREMRDFRRLNGMVQIVDGKNIPGPYKQEIRSDLLRKLLEIQKHLYETAPTTFQEYPIISDEELYEIRRIWVVEKHEFEDYLPKIYEEVMGEKFEGPDLDEHLSIGADDIFELKKVTENEPLQYELIRELIDIERRYNSMARRSGLYNDIEKAFKKTFFKDKNDAIEYASSLKEIRDNINDGTIENLHTQYELALEKNDI